MKDYFDLLSAGEKRLLGFLALGSAAALVLIAGVLVVRNPDITRTKEQLSRAEADLRHAEQSVGERRADWEGWQQARTDLERLRAGLLYEEEGAVEALRKDVGRILANVGASVTQLKYGYSGREGDPIKTITVAFTFRGSYASVKRLLSEIERYPRLLTIESIGFQKTGSGGILDLRLTLAGYHE